MNTQTMTPKAVHPTHDLKGNKTTDKDGYIDYTDKCDGFVIICNDQFSYGYINDPAKLAKLREWNAECLINESSYTRVSHRVTNRGSYKSTYLPGTPLGSF